MMLLESTLEKITSLLRVGFGEAGAGIIRANLNMQDGTCTINPLLPGKFNRIFLYLECVEYVVICWLSVFVRMFVYV